MPEEFNERVPREDVAGRAGCGRWRHAPEHLPCAGGRLGEFIDVEAESPEYAGMKIFAMGALNPLLDGSARKVAGAERVPGLARQATAIIGGVCVVRHQTGHPARPSLFPSVAPGPALWSGRWICTSSAAELLRARRISPALLKRSAFVI
jgi:hypothetical protein